MKKRLWAIFLSICLVVTLLPNVALAAEGKSNESGTTAELPELTKPATSGTSGGIDWKVEGGTLTITPSNSPKDGCTSGQMVVNYGTLTKKAPDDADYIAALTAAGYKPGSNGHFYYPHTDTWVSDSPWKFLSEQITKVVVEDGVTSIAARAFRLPNVTEVSIPASVKSIGNLVFEACKKLTTVNWTGDWTDHVSMPFNGFSRCSSLGEGRELTEWMPACFYVNADSDSIEGTQFTVDFDKLNKRLQNETTTYPLAMFRSVPKITSATLTSQLNVKYIFEYSGIQNVTIEADQPSIAEAAFRGCKDLKSVVIPTSVNQINVRAFADSGLKDITFSRLTSPTFGSFAFENVKLGLVTLNENMSVTEAVKIIGALTREGAITDSTTITPAKFANFNAENVVVDGAEGEAINHQSYPRVKNLTINGAYTAADSAFGNPLWEKETLENLTIHAPGENVTINKYAFMRAPLKSVKIEAEELKFTGDAAFLNTMLLTHIDLTGVDNITLDAGAGRTFVINDTNSGGKTAPIRYVYFKNAAAYKAMSSQFGGNTNTYYLVTNGGSVNSTGDGFGAVYRTGYSATWYVYDQNKSDNHGTRVTEGNSPTKGTTYIVEWTLDSASYVEVTYQDGYTDGSGVKEAVAKSGGTLAGENIFTRAGYTLTGWKVKDGDMIYGPGTTVDLSGDMTLVAQWTLDKPTISGATMAVYGKEVTLTANTKATVTSYQWYKGNTEILNAATNSLTLTEVADSGTYTVIITVGTDTATSEPMTVTITKANGTASVSMEGWTYGETAKTPVPTSETNGIGSVTYQYKVKDADDSTYSATVPTNAGSYTVKATFPATDNYNEVTATADFVIAQAPHHSSGSSGSSNPTYSVTTPSASNGSVTVSPKNASKGDRVTVTVKPDSGYTLETLTVIDSKGKEIQLTDKGEGKYTFTMPAGKVEVKATFMDDNTMLNFFVDVKSGDYYYDAVLWAAKNGITSGTDAVHFSPEQPCTRAQIVTFLWRAAGAPEPKGTAASLTDVVSGSYYEKAVAWAIENGITTGTGDGEFSPDDTCTRAQAVTFLARALSAKAASVAEFSDVPTDSYFADAVAWAAANGVTEGVGNGMFAPDNDCTRGQIVTFLFRAYNK